MEKLSKVKLDEAIKNVHTDSDLMDLAEDLGVSYKQLDFYILNKEAEATPCYGCKNLSCRHLCSFCSRGKEDMFKEADSSYLIQLS